MKNKLHTALYILWLVTATLLASCWAFEEKDISHCGPRDRVTFYMLDKYKRVSLANFVIQDGTNSFFQFEFPSDLSDLRLCVLETCRLKCTVVFADDADNPFEDFKLDGVIDIGYDGQIMNFNEDDAGNGFVSENVINLQQSFANMDHGWISGRVKISFKTTGTYQVEIDTLNQLLDCIKVDFTYSENRN